MRKSGDLRRHSFARARYESIRKGAWDDYKPQPARIAALAFMEKDADDASHWFDVEPGRHIQGLLAHLGGFYFIPVVAPDFLEQWLQRRESRRQVL